VCFCLQGRGEHTTTRFLLSDQCYAHARIEPTDNVNLWLGVRCIAFSFLIHSVCSNTDTVVHCLNGTWTDSVAKLLANSTLLWH